MKKLGYFIAALVAVAMTFSSCEDLDISNTNSLTDDDVQTLINSGNTLAIQAIGGGMDANFRLAGAFDGYTNNAIDCAAGQDVMLNFAGNDIVVGDMTSGKSSGAYEISMYAGVNSFLPWVGTGNFADWAFWRMPCYARVAADKALKYLTADAAKSTNLVKTYRAQALCAKAYAYITLMERFQPAYLHGGKEGTGMPIYTEYKVNASVEPSSAVDTYKTIIDWLKEAVALFKAYDTTNGGYTSAYDDVDCGVAQYLLARTYLETGDYAGCATACQDILSHYPNFIPQANYGGQVADLPAVLAGTGEYKADNNAFLAVTKNPEALLGWTGDLAREMASYQKAWAQIYDHFFNPFLYDGSSSHEYLYKRMDKDLYNKIDNNDFRKNNVSAAAFQFTYPSATASTYTKDIPTYTSLKYAATIALGGSVRHPTNYQADFVLYRSSEVWLMLAEAQYMNSNETGAITTLNQLLKARTKTGATTMTCANYDNGAYAGKTLDLIKLQWRIEMWGENGLDYLNAKRWNTAISRNEDDANGHWSKDVLSLEHMTWDIPDIEKNANPYWK